MNAETLDIFIVFAVMSCILLWFIIGSRGGWLKKFMVIALTASLCFAMWDSVDRMLGSPTHNKLPDKFQIHWITIKEPDKDNVNDLGSIKVWAQDVKKPRKNKLYQIPYSRKTHEQAMGILKLLKAGKVFMATMNGKGEGFGEGKGKGKGKGRKGKGKGDGKGGSISQDQVPMFYELPPPKFTDKITDEQH